MCFSFSVSQLCCLYVCSISTQKLQITRTPPQRITETENHTQTLADTILCTFTPLFVLLCSVLFCFVLFCFVSHPRSVSVRSKIPITRQNMSHKTEHVGHWEGLEMWLSVTTDSILPKAAEALRHQTQDQLDDNITSIMRQVKTTITKN